MKTGGKQKALPITLSIITFLSYTQLLMLTMLDKDFIVNNVTIFSVIVPSIIGIICLFASIYIIPKYVEISRKQKYNNKNLSIAEQSAEDEKNINWAFSFEYFISFTLAFILSLQLWKLVEYNFHNLISSVNTIVDFVTIALIVSSVFFTKTRGKPPLLSDSVSGGMDSAIKLHIIF